MEAAETTDTITCDCSENYGPCEDHCEVLAQREGASTRTADELVAVFIDDAAECINVEDCLEMDRAVGILRGWAREASEALDAVRNEHSGCAWLGADDGQWLYDLVPIVEGHLADVGLSVSWDDGYVIYRVSEDCPLVS